MQYKALLMVGVMVAFGCNSVDSTHVDTEGLSADFQVEATGDGHSDVRASLFVDGSFLNLESGDRLIASMTPPVAGATQTAEMDEQYVLGATWYTATFAIDDGDTELGIDFDRSASGKTSAPDSYVILPGRFTLDSSGNLDSFSRSDPQFNVGWYPDFASSDDVTYEITGDCIQMNSGSIPASANVLQIANNYLHSLAGQEDATCNVTVTIRVTRYGTVDPAIGEGGTFTATQTRSVTLESTP